MDILCPLNPMEDAQQEHGDLFIAFQVEYVGVFSVEGHISNASEHL